jgi:hypothetical protein
VAASATAKDKDCQEGCYLASVLRDVHGPILTRPGGASSQRQVSGPSSHPVLRRPERRADSACVLDFVRPVQPCHANARSGGLEVPSSNLGAPMNRKAPLKRGFSVKGTVTVRDGLRLDRAD